MFKYRLPQDWIKYSAVGVLKELAEAKATILSLQNLPYQKRWVDDLQIIQLKREVAGTSRIEGAEFTERELDIAMRETPAQLLTRSQRQAHAAANTYRWLKNIPDERPISTELICQIHRMIVTGADDDHCPPGVIRKRDQNVNFGSPRHRGVEGGDECERTFKRLCDAVVREFRDHDPLIQALALHYHFAAMHPFLDGNGRTARALEALMLRRAGLRNTVFIAMSNYYYDEKTSYLSTLSAVHSQDNDLTNFLVFGLKGITQQCLRLISEIKIKVEKSLFRNLMYDLFNRLKTQRSRVIAERQVEILKMLLEWEEIKFNELIHRTEKLYETIKNPRKALIRDINGLSRLGAISVIAVDSNKDYLLMIRLDWPTRMTETAFFEEIQRMPAAKTDGVLCQPNHDPEGGSEIRL